MRGEYGARLRYGPSLRELPPHARRIRGDDAGVDHFAGTTSACAENTLHQSPGLYQPRNYLRMRGEYRW